MTPTDVMMMTRNWGHDYGYGYGRGKGMAATGIGLAAGLGGGALLFNILSKYNFESLYISDINEEKIAKLKKEFKNNNKKLYIKQK